MERVKLSLLYGSVLIQSLSLYYLKIAQVLLGTATAAHPRRREEMGRNTQIVSLEKQMLLLENVECLCH